MRAKPKTIDDYLAALPADRREALEALRKTIKSIVPDAEEGISYSMPAFRVGGHVVAGFQATTKGCSYYPFSGSTLATLAAELASYTQTKSALHFDPKRPLPKALVRKLVTTRRAETKRVAAKARILTKLPAAMTGRASPAKAADGDQPVFDYIASLPEPQRSIAKRVDALAEKTLPKLQRAVKWGIAWYGVGDGWCFCCGGFAGHVKLTFGSGTSLTPVPPVTPIGMGKDSRGVDLESVDDLDVRQAASWMKQATALPGFGGKKR